MAYRTSLKRAGLDIARYAVESLSGPRDLKRIAHSVRLFPKGKGADAYWLTGVASQCDWAIVSDGRPPHVALRKTRRPERPRHIFLSMRSPAPAIRYFTEEVLPLLSERFVLVTGSEDVTLPNQTDVRFVPYDQATKKRLRHIGEHPLLAHWFAENLDEKWTPNISPLPTGFVFPEAKKNRPYKCPVVPKLADRPLLALCGHRIRSGQQWEPRRKVLELAKNAWAPFSRVIESPISEPEYLSHVEGCSFVMCVEGGGMDPSPKAWQAIQHGAIPIIRGTSVAQAYEHLPCMVIDDWRSDALTIEKLSAVKADLTEMFDDPALRAEVLHRLSLSFWWERISSFARSP